VVFWGTSSILAIAEPKQLLSPEACTEIRYLAPDNFTSLSPLQISPDGNRVAYVVQVPNTASNDNNDELFVTAVDGKTSTAPVEVLTGEFIAAIRWFADNRHLAVLIRQGNRVVLSRVDSATKRQETIWDATGDITDYSMDATGENIAVAVRVRDDASSVAATNRDSRKGYRIDLESIAPPDDKKRAIYILKRTDDSHWRTVREITMVSPLSGQMLDSFKDAHDLHVSLSPDGHYLLFDNAEMFANIPNGGIWGNSAQVQYLRNRGFEGLVVSYLYDVLTTKVSMPLKSPITWDAIWAPDSKSYVEVAMAPVGSSWEAADLATGAPNDHSTHLFSVDVVTGNVSEVSRRAEKAPVAWTITGDIIIRDPATGDLRVLNKDSGQWKQINTYRIPLPDTAPYLPITSDGRRIVMEYENTRTPPQLIAFEPSSTRLWTVAKLNPQADSLILPQSTTVTWTTSTGFEAKGLLLLPPDYDPHRRYPLVIEDGSILYSGEFVCDSGAAHVSSFARGILADSGIAYLMRYWPGSEQWENSYYPKNYPGYLAEAAFKQDLVESAVKSLDERGIIDPTKIGLIGFSRGGWYVDYALTHSHIHFQAATTTDNVQYSMGEYWYSHSEGLVRNQEGMYGGPPYGPSLKNWLDYSVSFTLDRIHTPLLMEVMGYGQKDDDPSRLPDNLAVHNEVFVGLITLKKPAELYYYPDEKHQPDHPQARISSLWRNLDWYRFWLQGYERPDPGVHDQYKRWEEMRLQQLHVEGATASTAPSPTRP
jgi:dipeptidyl aminopeptidase/acylaminoacyl peptidase